jgi:hypothetical protein
MRNEKGNVEMEEFILRVRLVAGFRLQENANLFWCLAVLRVAVFHYNIIVLSHHQISLLFLLL